MKPDNRQKTLEDEEFVQSPQYEFSLERVLEAHPDGVSDQMAARLLMLDPEALKKLYAQVLIKLRNHVD